MAPGFSYNNEDALYFGKYKTVMGDYESYNTPSYVFVALYLNTVNDRRVKGELVDLSFIEPHFQVFREECQKFGIWSDENFGLWSYLEVSC